ncbi:hypothetical protein HANVADRAFT_912 [Hanseniaspora valbyensis NRRL Y-1626]|uniref:Uncharacterized protein n=1 Tax=Hanseniaspora valbyensis NRRL Y-1626 TaxID=766949 RepID=A0A1B7THT5_9ASCO|nr:hypothetical protein HANVADRAFT_912 [Hanseniaspora valbyensis NRRL Y-1626]
METNMQKLTKEKSFTKLVNKFNKDQVSPIAETTSSGSLSSLPPYNQKNTKRAKLQSASLSTTSALSTSDNASVIPIFHNTTSPNPTMIKTVSNSDNENLKSVLIPENHDLLIPDLEQGHFSLPISTSRKNINNVSLDTGSNLNYGSVKQNNSNNNNTNSKNVNDGEGEDCVCPPGNPLGEYCLPLYKLISQAYKKYPHIIAALLLLIIIGIITYSFISKDYRFLYAVLWFFKWLFCLFSVNICYPQK